MDEVELSQCTMYATYTYSYNNFIMHTYSTRCENLPKCKIQGYFYFVFQQNLNNNAIATFCETNKN